MNDGPPNDYANNPLRREDIDADPFVQFGKWFEEAKAAGGILPEGLTLATVDGEGRPSARIVLLKGFDESGFTFFTNYDSRKSRELAANPNAALVFWWPALERQLRIEGTVTRVSEAESDAYFATRPRGSQLGAWASNQSGTIEEGILEARLAEIERRYERSDVPRPPHWGGFRLDPEMIELWQGRPNRLHDRFRYLRTGGRWAIDRLAP